MTDYLLERKIGSGSFGEVFSGKNKHTGVKVAIKRLNKAALMKYGNYILNAFWREIDCMKKCECENSVKLFQNFETQHNFNIIMELCDTDLLYHLNEHRGGLPKEQVRDTFQQLNNVFRLMNKNNIVHRDLKLSNILIKYTDKNKTKFIPKLSDYGFSKELNNNRTGTHLGTPATMAPEVIMDLPYGNKSDLWSIGVMIYQLYFKALPYNGFGEEQILAQIRNKVPIKKSNDDLLDDLISKLLIMNPNNRISWDDYFNHPFFTGVICTRNIQNNFKNKYEKISDINVGFMHEKNLYECYIAKKPNGEKVIIKSYDIGFIGNNQNLFDYEYELIKAFKGNKNCLKLIENYTENNKIFLVFEYIEGEILSEYCKKNELSENEIRIMIKELYNNIFIFNDYNNFPFLFISKYSFLINTKNNNKPIIFDFGFHKFFVSTDEYTSYFCPKTNEFYTSEFPIKTNVMNFGMTILKTLYNNNFKIEDKAIILPQNKIISPEFKEFISKSIFRNINIRASWVDLGRCKFIFDNVKDNLIDENKYVLLNEEKLFYIYDEITKKYNNIVNYYSKDVIEKNKDIINYFKEIESFIIINIFEMNLILKFFEASIKKKSFSPQHEISLISINSMAQISKCNLNFGNLLLKDVNLIKVEKNEKFENFIVSLKLNIKKMSGILKKLYKLHKFPKQENYQVFFKNIIKNFDDFKFVNYFYNIISRNENEGNKDLALEELIIAKYISEFILFIVDSINTGKNKKINFAKEDIIQQFHNVFDDKENKIEISKIKGNENYLLISFIGVVLRKFSSINYSETDSKMQNLLTSANGLQRFYPFLMKKIENIENKVEIKDI